MAAHVIQCRFRNSDFTMQPRQPSLEYRFTYPVDSWLTIGCVESTDVCAVGFEQGTYAYHWCEWFVKVKNIKVIFSKDFAYLSWQPWRYRNPGDSATKWDRHWPAYGGNLLFKVPSSFFGTRSYDFDFMSQLNELMSQISDVADNPTWEGIVIWRD